MPESTFRFDPDLVFSTLSGHWPWSKLAAPIDMLVGSSTGQIQINEDEGQHSIALVEVLVERSVITLEVGNDVIAAQVVSLITTLPGFPDDGSVVLYEWGPPEIPLRPTSRPEDLVAAHVG